MEFIFLDASGKTLFTRDDIESGHWVQEEMTVNADFPLVPGKIIQRGMRIAFRDPATDNLEVFEIRNVKNTIADAFQQITAEHIAISELSDEHIDTTEINNKTAQEALALALKGTLWSVGTNTASGTQSGDFGRGSVWNAVTAIKANWNVYITPRVVISSAGVITGRYLDISPAEGTWRGLRLSIRKNLLDPAVTYDDSEVLTALYGYGGNVDVAKAGSDDVSETLTFASQVWTKTDSHPAKPAGQKYLEWPEKTAIYGRNGRPRFGYYQNGDITDGAILLQKTWESLKETAEPKIIIEGTCVDLYRLGYKDEPLRLHDLALVEIEETGELIYKEIIMLDVDLVDPSGNRPQIGDYIPNIVYIDRETNSYATTGEGIGGGGSGGGGRRGKTNLQDQLKTHETWFEKNDDLIGMFAGVKDGKEYLKVGQICLAINESDDILANIKADHVNISATQTAHMLAGSIVYDAQGNLVLKESTGGGVLVEHNDKGTTARFGVWDKGNLTGGVMAEHINGQEGTVTRIFGDKIIVGNGGEYSGDTLDGSLTDITSDFTTVRTLIAKKIDADYISADRIRSLVDGGSFSRLSCTTLLVGGISYAPNAVLGGVTATNNNGTITFKQKFMGGSETTIISFEKGDTEAAYNQGWNDCIDAASRELVLHNYDTLAGGRVVDLYTASGAPVGSYVWRYGGSTVYRYSLPDRKE